MKRVLLIVVDGWTPRVFGPALERGELPCFRELTRRGSLVLDCVSIFPSITPAATASILTGEYPTGHGIAGMSWWNAETGEISYFGDDVRTVLRRGAGEFLRDFLLKLNGDRLQAPTLFQLVERRNRRAACFNHLIFRGDVPHRVTNPWLLQWLPGVGEGFTVHGPSWLCLGDFIATTGGAYTLDAPGGVFNRFGLDDEGTARFLKDLPGASALPDFTVAYFADYDFDSHARGPDASLDTLRQLDRRLADLFEHWGGLDRVLEDACIVMTADHGHSEVRDDGDAGVAVDPILAEYGLTDAANGWRRDEDLLVCPNMRAIEIFHRRGRGFDREIAARLLEDRRIDQVIWRAERDGDDEFHVMTADRGALHFRRSRGAAGGAEDAYGGRWQVAGDPEALDLRIEGGRLMYGTYPNALERIASGVDYPRVGRLWATARVGYEFAAPGQRVHGGAGSHGTLHELDSCVPLLIVGAPDGSALPAVTPRIVDVAPVCCEVLGIPFRPPAGATRAYPGASGI